MAHRREEEVPVGRVEGPPRRVVGVVSLARREVGDARHPADAYARLAALAGGDERDARRERDGPHEDVVAGGRRRLPEGLRQLDEQVEADDEEPQLGGERSELREEGEEGAHRRRVALPVAALGLVDAERRDDVGDAKLRREEQVGHRPPEQQVERRAAQPRVPQILPDDAEQADDADGAAGEEEGGGEAGAGEIGGRDSRRWRQSRPSFRGRELANASCTSAIRISPHAGRGALSTVRSAFPRARVMLILSVATDALAAPARPKPPAPLTSRSVAHRVLLRCARDGAFADRALSAELDAAPELPAGGRRHATELVYGVMRNSALLDHHLGQLTNLTRADLKTRTILRIGAHETLHLRTADHAALNEAVALGKNRVQRSYVNGVLRSLVRGRDADTLVAPESLAVRTSTPQWLLDDVAASLDDADEVAAWAEASQQAPRLALRVNAHRCDPDAACRARRRRRRRRGAPGGRRLAPRPRRRRVRMPGFAEGLDRPGRGGDADRDARRAGGERPRGARAVRGARRQDRTPPRFCSHPAASSSPSSCTRAS